MRLPRESGIFSKQKSKRIKIDRYLLRDILLSRKGRILSSNDFREIRQNIIK